MVPEPTAPPVAQRGTKAKFPTVSCLSSGYLCQQTGRVLALFLRVPGRSTRRC